MEKLKSVVRVAGILLLILAAVCMFFGIKGLIAIRPASDYEDKGIHTFSPYRVLPVQVENTTTGRNQRLHPKKTVYRVYYRTTDGTKYEWKLDLGPSKSRANQILSKGENVDRRVLSIKDNDSYITIESKLTADTYTDDLKQRNILMAGLSAGYLVIYFVACAIALIRNKSKI